MELALRGLRRYPKTTALAVLTVAIGLAASMTTLALLHMLSADPLRGRSQHLHLAWVDTVLAKSQTYRSLDSDWATYDYKRLKTPDAEALLAAHKGTLQAAMADLDAQVGGDKGEPSNEQLLATSSDFIPMFGVALQDGRNWTAAEDAARTPVAVIDSELAQKLFGTPKAIGRVVQIKHHAFRVIGVSQPYAPQPHFYGLNAWTFSGNERESIFVPFGAAIDVGLASSSTDGCDDVTEKSKQYIAVDPMHCEWLAFWVQLDTPQEVTAYRSFLDHYAQQQPLGSFGKKPQSQLLSVQRWLTLQNAIPDNVRLNVLLAGSFLLLCMVNVAGLLAAKFMRRGAEVGIRRALGASRRAVMLHHLFEAGMVCLLGGVLAWPLTLLGLALLRMQDQGFTDLARLDVAMFAALFALALAVGVLVGLLPSWRVSMVQPGLQVKSA
ncbi:ABC transporter permease [Dyella nitratireducens]|uniref:ABC transporter ATP-binding protein n=1 Tax=Dyella nitratireducens TaxID=1849580 RepID=A0ABQ1FPS6_9GAMM|nr:ABC transporter permease [Dyella nitratireducens]GGA22619.1 ABC transporter ATP-binding protein [Dyella nitratireducens]GLQ44086.1 ABC transporter ATP-binding protein [Dyella nitratireducens]